MHRHIGFFISPEMIDPHASGIGMQISGFS